MATTPGISLPAANRWKLLLCGLLLLLWQIGNTSPLVEIDQPTLQLALPPYIDILEDAEGTLTIDDVTSDRYAFQFAPAPMTELFFGYTTSVYWLRFTVENQRDNDMSFVLEATPADIDFLDLYELDPHTGEMMRHQRTGSAMPYQDRNYNYPLYLFDLNIDAHAAYTYYLRAESNKTINLQLTLSTPHEYLHRAGVRDWWQGFTLGGLLLVAILYASLFYLFKFKGFLWYSLFMLFVIGIQVSWNGYLLQFFDADDLLLDRQILSPIYLSVMFSSLFAQSLLGTRKRSRWQHHLLDTFIVICLAGSVITWFVDAYANSLFASLIALLSTIIIFGLTLHANMEGHRMARHFLLARTMTTGMILVAIFNIHGYLPQGEFTAWGISGAIILEAVIMAISMSWCCLRDIQKKKTLVTEQTSMEKPQSLVNLADICHELRTPISGVMGMTDLLLDGTLTEQQRNQIKTIRKSGQALLDVTNKISDISLIEVGNIELNFSQFELTTLIESCVENSRSRAEFNNIELIYNIDTKVAGFVRGDQEKMQQAIINLLHFALRHLDQGEVILTAAPGADKQTLITIRSGHNTLLERNTLQDNRPLDSSDQLNLTIAEQYIQLMGGKVSVQQYLDGGMNISFGLPLESHQSGAPGSQHDDNLILQGRSLLIVDDNSTCCAIIGQQAIQWGMSAQSAHSGKEALAILRSRTTVDEPFDIVLVDYDMPGMNGLELVDHIHDDNNINSEKLLMIMLTGVSKAPGKIMAENAHIQRVLYKPLSGKSLKQALQSALAQHLHK